MLSDHPDHAQRARPACVGLALSGGVARGPAHLGVLRTLTAAQVPVAVVAGASAGAIVGALYCAGVGAEQAEALLGGFGWWRIARPVWPRRGWVSFDRLESWLARIIGDVNFAGLQRPFAVAATDLETGEPVVLREGRVARAVHASCAVPGFVEPVEHHGRLLGDGGISNNLPVSAARLLGADYVIGVDLFRPLLRRGWGPFGFGVAALENFVRRSGGGINSADCLICPDLAGESYLRFRRRKELVEIGARAAQEKLPEILSVVRPPDGGV